MSAEFGRIVFARDLAAWCESYAEHARTGLAHPSIADEDLAFLKAQIAAAQAMAEAMQARAKKAA